ncbi:hypothetical protein AVEN_266470-1 [Araneus ventricosus]|uniref:Uncharacterized protein n=1 Tax=Araneus ventricosus TaxID=182803 RepID=A0A4Y2E196_ARAVE|nr:hypothetical protein AVEN_266470-1 [Araneus ventricosus]
MEDKIRCPHRQPVVFTYSYLPPVAMNQSIATCTKSGNSYRNHSSLDRSRSVDLSDGRCNSSSAEAGVLMTITGNVPTLSKGGSFYHLQRARPNHYCSHVQEGEPAYLYGGFSSTYSWCPQVGPIKSGNLILTLPDFTYIPKMVYGI